MITSYDLISFPDLSLTVSTQIFFCTYILLGFLTQWQNTQTTKCSNLFLHICMKYQIRTCLGNHRAKNDQAKIGYRSWHNFTKNSTFIFKCFNFEVANDPGSVNGRTFWMYCSLITKSDIYILQKFSLFWRTFGPPSSYVDFF